MKSQPKRRDYERIDKENYIDNRWKFLWMLPLKPISLLGLPFNWMLMSITLWPAQFRPKKIETGKREYENLIEFIECQSPDSIFDREKETEDDPFGIDIETHKKKKEYLRNNSLDLGKVKLHGVEIKARDSTESQSLIPCHIFYIPGNAKSVFSLENEATFDIIKGKKESLEITAHLIAPRGTGINADGLLTKAFYSDQVINDYIAIIKHEIDKTGIGKEKAYQFVIKGTSLGAGFAAQIASGLHKKGYHVLVNLDRTMKSTGAFVSAGLSKRIKFSESHISIGPSERFLGFFTGLLRWQFNTGKHSSMIREGYGSYSVVKHRKPKKGEDYKGNYRNADGVIPYYGSLHYYLKRERKQFKDEWTSLNDELDSSKNQNTETNLSDILQNPAYKYTDAFSETIALMDQMYNDSSILYTTINTDNKSSIHDGLDYIKYRFVDCKKFSTKKDDDPNLHGHNEPPGALTVTNSNTNKFGRRNLRDVFIETISAQIKYHKSAFEKSAGKLQTAINNTTSSRLRQAAGDVLKEVKELQKNHPSDKIKHIEILNETTHFIRKPTLQNAKKYLKQEKYAKKKRATLLLAKRVSRLRRLLNRAAALEGLALGSSAASISSTGLYMMIPLLSLLTGVPLSLFDKRRTKRNITKTLIGSRQRLYKTATTSSNVDDPAMYVEITDASSINSESPGGIGSSGGSKKNKILPIGYGNT